MEPTAGRIERLDCCGGVAGTTDEHLKMMPSAITSRIIKLTAKETRLIELTRILEKQDDTFKYLQDSFIDVLSILKERGSEYNGNTSGVMEQVYDLKDMSAYVHTSRPLKRAKQILSDSGMRCSDAKILDKIIDTIGYSVMWLCCRKRVKSEGLN